jgi:hypothetical protein
VFYQIGKGLSRVRVREALRVAGLNPDAWTWMYNPRSGVVRVVNSFAVPNLILA